MQTFQRSTWNLVKGLVVAPFTALVVYVALGFFFDNTTIPVAAAILVFLVLVYLSVFSENIRFELTKDGYLSYFKCGRLQNELNLTLHCVGYHRRNETGFLASQDITLEIVSLEDGTQVNIDCSPLGLKRFESMYQAIKQYASEEIEVLKG